MMKYLALACIWCLLGASNTPSKSREIRYVPATHSTATTKKSPARSPKTIVTEHVTISEIPKKKAPAPLCIQPKALGLPSVTSCGDLHTLGALDQGLIHLQLGLGECTFMNDLSCDDGSGGGMEAYRHHLKSKGYASDATQDMQRLDAPGDCLKVNKRANGDYDIANAIRGEVLCCRAVCNRPNITTTETALLPMEEPVPLPYQPVTTVTTAMPATIYTRPDRPWCVLPQYLDLPRVRTCEDLRDVAASTEYLTLTNSSLLDCAWVLDRTCDPSYPAYGQRLGSARPHASCLAIRQDVCDTNIIGAWPLLSRHFRGICKAPATTTQYATVALPQKKGGRRLGQEEDDEDEQLLWDEESDGASLRRLNGNNQIMATGSDSLLVCCRLDCTGIASNDEVLGGDVASGHNGSAQVAPPPAPTVDLGEAYYQDGNTTVNPANSTPKVAMGVDNNDNSTSLCDVRYAQVCSLAAPLQGQKVIFDQHCLNENMPAGCYAGGISRCCRSIPL